MRKTGLNYLDATKLATLATELAMNYRDRPDILRTYGLTEEEFYEVQQIDFFRRTFEAAVVDWHGPLNTETRVKLGAAHYVEKGLPVLGARMVNKEEPLNSAVDTGRFLAKLAGMGEKEKDQNDADRFVITINLGADQKLKFDKSVAIDAKDITPEQRALKAITKP